MFYMHASLRGRVIIYYNITIYDYYRVQNGLRRTLARI